MKDNLTDVLLDRSKNEREKQAYVFLRNGKTETETLTYLKLEKRAKAIAFYLQSLCQPGDRALLLYPPGLEFIVAFYGCLLGGIIAVPAYPPRKQGKNSALLSILEDAQPTVILTESSILDNIQRRLGDKKQPILATDKIEIEPGSNWEKPQINGETIAFLQYTSGSTGNPKGVIITHENLIHNQEMIKLAFGHSEKTKFVGWLPLFHDMGLIGNILQPMYLGIPAILMSPIAFLQKPIRWLKAISQYQGTTSGGPNFAYDLCAEKITTEQKENLDLSSWEVAFNGAEPINAQTLEKFITAFENCGFRREAFYPCYGMAEATLFVSGGRKTAPPIIENLAGNSSKIVGCGQGCLDEKIVIVNPQSLNECEAKEVGEIWVSSASVAKGYWNKTEATEQTFKADLKSYSEHFLRTGDLGFVKDGELFITGRLKELIIIRGRNYYPQDIERIAEKSHPSLRANCSAAFGVEINEEEKLVVIAEVERSQVRSLNADVVIGSMKKTILEELEIGVYAIQLLIPASLPKTSSGKIKRLACKQGFLEGTLNIIGEWRENTNKLNLGQFLPNLETTSTAEQIQAWLVAKIYQIKKVTLDIKQPLTHYGLDSLQIAEISAELGDQLGCEISPNLMYKHPNIETLIPQLVREIELSPSNSSITPLPLSKQKYWPLSYTQESYLLCNELEPRGTLSIIYVAIKFQGKLNFTALEQSINEIIKCHEILRTNITIVNGEPMQVIAPIMTIPIVRVNFQDIPEQQREAKAKKWAETEIHRPFDLAGEPLLRVHLLQLGKADNLFLLTMHHLLGDAWSISLFFRELAILYQAFVAGLPNPLPPPSIQQKDWSVWERSHLTEEVINTKIKAWKQDMGSDFTILQLPTDKPRSSTVSSQITTEVSEINPETTQALRAFSKTKGVTLFVTLLTAFKVLLYQLSGQEKILINTPTFKRKTRKIQKLMGTMANMLIMQTNLSGNPSFESLLKRVNQEKLRAYQYEDLPFIKIVEEFRENPNQDLRSGVWFNLFSAVSFEQVKFPEIKLNQISLPRNNGCIYELLLFCHESQEKIIVKWLYKKDLFNADTIAEMKNRFDNLLDVFIQEPQRKIDNNHKN